MSEQDAFNKKIVKVGWARRYGAHNFQIATEIEVSYVSESEVTSAIEKEVLNIAAHFDHLEKNIVPNLPNTTTAEQGGTRQEWLPVSLVVVEFKNNRKQISLKGGNFTQYGIPVYEDSLEEDFLNLTEWGFGEEAPKVPAKMLVEFKGGKPKRVLKVHPA